MRRVDGNAEAGGPRRRACGVDLVNGRFGALSWMSLNMIGVRPCLAGVGGWSPTTAGRPIHRG